MLTPIPTSYTATATAAANPAGADGMPRDIPAACHDIWAIIPYANAAPRLGRIIHAADTSADLMVMIMVRSCVVAALSLLRPRPIPIAIPRGL
ncbi:hypothetical protein EYC84_006649 [Monilinia fructicola]|uniref:Uncharacterized protein n=1 Tax=Monilinia fructicola TaxID=38448 RepID=A0A5M9K4K6_MONFR|nr:hypothetical protein EYC84_006649 [Monilinia fructicola]